MIDLDRIDAQLAAAVTEAGPAPAAVRPRPVPPTAGVAELLELGQLEEVDLRIAAATDRRDQATWAAMRALLDGRRDAVRTGIDTLLRLAREGDDAEALDRSSALRFWAAFEWGTEEERLDALDHCRDRAYRFDDLQWWGNLTLLLAATGKQDEGVRAFDAALQLVPGVRRDGARLDVVTNLVEAAALLGDTARVARAGRQLRTPTGRLVVVGEGVVCKGSVDRYLGLVHAAAGDAPAADRYFSRAASAHRALGAGPLLARTLQQASALVAA